MSRPHIMDVLRDRVLLCDGAMGSRVQALTLDTEKDFLGRENCTEVLNISRPELVREIHKGYFEAGADMAFLEAPRTMEDVAAVPKLVRGPCLLNVVWGGKTPEIDLRDAETFGYKLAIVPGLLFKAAIGACDDALAALKATHKHPEPRRGMTVQDAFNRAGAAEWGVFRTKYRDAAIAKAAE